MCIFRVRLRKKTWKNPGTVFLDYHVYEEDISISSNWEVFLEVLNGSTNSIDSLKVSLFVFVCVACRLLFFDIKSECEINKGEIVLLPKTQKNITGMLLLVDMPTVTF